MYEEIKQIILQELKDDKNFRQVLIKILFDDEEIREYTRQILK